MKVLFIGSHADDIELCCGGTIHKRKDDWDIQCCTLSNITTDGYNLEEDSKKSLEVLGVKNCIFYDHAISAFEENRWNIREDIKKVISDFAPNVIFTQNKDIHQDHITTYHEVMRCIQHLPISLICFSLCLDIKHNYYETLAEEDINQKIKALSCYESYKNKYYFNPKYHISRAVSFGSIGNRVYSEQFSVIRLFDSF